MVLVVFVGFRVLVFMILVFFIIHLFTICSYIIYVFIVITTNAIIHSRPNIPKTLVYQNKRIKAEKNADLSNDVRPHSQSASNPPYSLSQSQAASIARAHQGGK